MPKSVCEYIAPFSNGSDKTAWGVMKKVTLGLIGKNLAHIEQCIIIVLGLFLKFSHFISSKYGSDVADT
jgi:hypothetical protein